MKMNKAQKGENHLMSPNKRVEVVEEEIRRSSRRRMRRGGRGKGGGGGVKR